MSTETRNYLNSKIEYVIYNKEELKEAYVFPGSLMFVGIFVFPLVACLSF